MSVVGQQVRYAGEFLSHPGEDPGKVCYRRLQYLDVRGAETTEKDFQRLSPISGDPENRVGHVLGHRPSGILAASPEDGQGVAGQWSDGSQGLHGRKPNPG